MSVAFDLKDQALEEIDYSGLSERELIRLERQIAAEHIGKTPWLAITWAFLNLAVWLSLWPLTLMGIIPFWLTLIIASINVALSYLPSHEAQHDIIAKPGEKLRWLNQLVGHLSPIPMVMPYRILKATHMEHHKHANHPELDPDIGCEAETPLKAIWATFLMRQPHVEGKSSSANYAKTLERIGKSHYLLDGLIYNVLFYGLMCAMAWSGYALEAAVLWWLPRHIGLSYIVFYLSWAPHHPSVGYGRYKDTKSFKSIFGNIGSAGMQYHIIHHLHPRIPLYRTPRAYRQMRPLLEARGAPVDELKA